MANKNWKWYVDNDDLMGCYERFCQARSNWKDHWWSTIEEIFNNSIEWCKQYVIDPIERTITQIVEKVTSKHTRSSKYDEVINDNGFDIRSKNGELCYLFEFYNDDDELLCSKVGTTTRTIRQRLIEELRSKTYKGMGATKAIVNRVYNCGDLPAEGLESLIRSEYIKKYPRSFKKNDRFIGELFDFDLCDKIANDYLLA